MRTRIAVLPVAFATLLVASLCLAKSPASLPKGKVTKVPLPPVPQPSQPQNGDRTGLERFEFKVYAGYSNFLSNEDKAFWPQGLNGGVWVGCQLDKRAVLGIRLDYFYFEPSLDEFNSAYLGGANSPQFIVTGIPSMNMVRLIPSLKLNLNPNFDSPIRPSLIVGAGLMNKSMAVSRISGNSGASSAAIPGTSENMFLVSAAVEIPINLPDGFFIPLGVELASGFSEGQPTTFRNISIGLGREW